MSEEINSIVKDELLFASTPTEVIKSLDSMYDSFVIKMAEDGCGGETGSEVMHYRHLRRMLERIAG